MKLKIEIDQCSENPKEWEISLAMEGITLSGNFKTFQDIIIWGKSTLFNP